MSNEINWDNFSYNDLRKSQRDNIQKSFIGNEDNSDNNISKSEETNNVIEEKEKLVSESIIKSLDSYDIMKGKRATIGEIREWSGKKYQKTVNGWIPYRAKGDGAESLKDGDIDVTDAKENKEELNSSEDIDGKSINVGDRVTVSKNLTTDPNNKRGKGGEIISINESGDIKLKFEDGSIGNYREGTVILVNKKQPKLDVNITDKNDIGFKTGDKVKLNNDVNLMSLHGLKKQKLEVVGTVKKGLISQPEFIKVKDEDGKTHELNPDYISKL